MAKIDLSGNSGWQSESSDQIKALQDGSYDYRELKLDKGEHNVDWLKSGLIVQILSGHVVVETEDGLMEYEKNQIIYLNDENIIDFKLVANEETKLGIFKEKT